MTPASEMRRFFRASSALSRPIVFEKTLVGVPFKIAMLGIWYIMNIHELSWYIPNVL